MTNEELNTKIYEKLFAEQQEYKGWLLTQSPEDILKHAYEYTVRDDIVLAMEYLNLTDEQAKALIDSEKTLETIFNTFENIEGNHMDDVRECIENRANETIVAQKEALRILPLYIYSANFAKEHSELEVYRASHRANVECKNAIENAISNHYRDNRLNPACVQEVIDRFGMERTAFILANTVQDKDWDGRIADENKKWAKEFSISNNSDAWGGRRTHEYVCTEAHPGLINLFVSRFRKDHEAAKERKPSVLKKLKEISVERQPKAPSKKKEVEL